MGLELESHLHSVSSWTVYPNYIDDCLVAQNCYFPRSLLRMRDKKIIDSLSEAKQALTPIPLDHKVKKIYSVLCFKTTLPIM